MCGRGNVDSDFGRSIGQCFFFHLLCLKQKAFCLAPKIIKLLSVLDYDDH